jgi:hypothetical protein
VTKLYLAQIPKHFMVSRGTIYRDIRQGKLSAEDNGKGRTVVDLSELERVYKGKGVAEVSHSVQSDSPTRTILSIRTVCFGAKWNCCVNRSLDMSV